MNANRAGKAPFPAMASACLSVGLTMKEADMTIVSNNPVTLSSWDETTLEICAIIDEARLSTEAVSTYEVAKRAMEISREHFVEELKSALNKELAPLREQMKQLADHLRAAAQPEYDLPLDVVNGIRRAFTDNRH